MNSCKPKRMGGSKAFNKVAKEEQAYISLKGWFDLLKKLTPINKKLDVEVNKILENRFYDEMVDKAHSIQRMVDKI